MSYLRYLCLLAHNGVQQILRFVLLLFFFVVLVYPMLRVSLDFQNVKHIIGLYKNIKRRATWSYQRNGGELR
jgi:hypothetical protein